MKSAAAAEKMSEECPSARRPSLNVPSSSMSTTGTLLWSDIPPNMISRPAEKLRVKESLPLCHLPVPKVWKPDSPRSSPRVRHPSIVR